MPERRAVRLVEHVAADLDHVVGAHAEHERVERAVVDRAHGDPVRDDRLAAVRILLDVRDVQELAGAEAVQGALGPIGLEHPAAGERLVQPLADGPLGVLTPADEVRGSRERLRPPRLAPDLVEGEETCSGLPSSMARRSATLSAWPGSGVVCLRSFVCHCGVEGSRHVPPTSIARPSLSRLPRASDARPGRRVG